MTKLFCRFFRLVILTAALLSAVAFPAFAQGNRPSTVADAIRSILDSEDQTLDGIPLDRAALHRFYAARDFGPAWTGSKSAQRQAALALSALAGAADDGLEPTDYHSQWLAQTVVPVTATTVAERDVILTNGFVRYAHDLRLGRVSPDRVGHDIGLPIQSFDAVTALGHALADGELAALIENLPPPYADYNHLKAALARYRALAAQGGWPRFDPGPEIRLGTDDPRIVMLQRRLAAEAGGGGDLADVVRNYQANNGLDVDGRVGPRTQAMLAVPAAQRVDQIAVNMERWRWLPRTLGERYVMVNVADAQLKAVNGGKLILTSRVIVGDRAHPSPMLKTTAVAVTVNPPWNVPPSIARREMLPKLRRDPAYLQKQNMILLNGPPGDPQGLAIDWRAMSARAFPYRLQQRPGPANSLGVVKVEMPNSFDVYLHDTPMRTLFARPERTLSHGCIRVEQVQPLASFALTGSITEALDDLRDAITSGETRRFAVKNPLPIYLLYWTAVANDDGSIGFRPDPYGRDRPVHELLQGHRQVGTGVATLRACPTNSTG